MHSIQCIERGMDFHVSNKLADFIFFGGKGHCLEEKSYTRVADSVRSLYARTPVFSQYEL